MQQQSSNFFLKVIRSVLSWHNNDIITTTDKEKFSKNCVQIKGFLQNNKNEVTRKGFDIE